MINTKPGSEELNYYSDIPKDCNVSNDIFMDLWMKFYPMFDELRETFKKKDMNHGHHVNLILQEMVN